MSNADILAILQSARLRNERLGITGMLLYKDGNFMQTLEGPEAPVLTLIEKIGKDTRHRGVLRLLNKRIEERVFPNWSMAFTNLDALEGATPGDESAFSPFLTESLLDDKFRQQPEACYKLMLRFKSSMR